MIDIVTRSIILLALLKFETELSVCREKISELRPANKEENMEIRDLKKVVGHRGEL